MNPITSHRHGKGRFADYAWGSVESCAECAAEKARDEARQAWAKEYREELQGRKVNQLLSTEKEYSEPYAQFSLPTAHEALMVLWVVIGILSVWGLTQ